MRRVGYWFVLGLAVATTAVAAPNVTNVTQKGSLLIFPDIQVGNFNTLVRIQNDGSADVDVKCYWMDGNKNRVDFIIPVTRNQPIWFDAMTGRGTYQVNPFPNTNANGFDNPFLIGPPGISELNDNSGPYFEGLLACWAVDGGGQQQVKWNHLSGTATVYNPFNGAYEYNAYAFFAPTGVDMAPVGVAGTLNLNGVDYDSCPLYLIDQFTPDGGRLDVNFTIPGNRLAVVGCTLNLNQDWQPVFTKLQFDVWNEDEVKFTGAYECADSWHETWFTFSGSQTGGALDAASQNFLAATLGTFSARYRVQGVSSTQCPNVTTQAVGLLGVHTTFLRRQAGDISVGTALAGAGKMTGKVVWDPAAAVPEGGVR